MDLIYLIPTFNKSRVDMGSSAGCSVGDGPTARHLSAEESKRVDNIKIGSKIRIS